MTTQTQQAADAAAQTGRAVADGVETVMASYGRQWQQWSEWTNGLLGQGGRGPTGQFAAWRDTCNRLAEGTRELAAAHTGVAMEWLRAPFWLVGAGSPADLQARYMNLIETRRRVARTLLDAALGVNQAVSEATEQTVETARDVLDTQARAARRVASDVREAQTATVEATRSAAESARQAADRVVEQARDVAETASTQIRETAQNGAGQSRDIARAATPPAPDVKPAPAREQTRDAARTADSPAQAEAESTAIKANTSRDGQKIYHTPGQANYDRVEPDMVFETEEAAREAGYRPAQR